MKLPSSLRWIEVDLPEILSYKEEILRQEKPACSLERVRLDLSNGPARREVFNQLGQQAKKAVVITEGLIIYLERDAVAEIAQDLAAPPAFRSWIVDIASPGLMKMLKKRMSSQLGEAAPFKFAPEEGPAFFTRFGWQPIEVRSLLKSAAQLKRLPFLLRLVALLPETEKSRRDRPWSGICLLSKT
jgi:O-methyltransferase involved in polyketide biosynthesis